MNLVIITHTDQEKLLKECFYSIVGYDPVNKLIIHNGKKYPLEEKREWLERFFSPNIIASLGRTSFMQQSSIENFLGAESKT